LKTNNFISHVTTA